MSERLPLSSDELALARLHAEKYTLMGREGLPDDFIGRAVATIDLREAHRQCAIEAERKDATRIMGVLAGAHFCTPEETYGFNSSWAISDLIRAFKSLPKPNDIRKLYTLIGVMASENDGPTKYFAERVQYQIELAFPEIIDWRFKEKGESECSG